MSAAWASHPHSCIPSSRAHLHLRTSCSKRFCTIRPLSCMSAPTFVGWSRSRPDAPTEGHTTIAHARPHGWPRLCVQLLAAMDFPTPSVSYTLCTQKCKTLSYGQYAPDSLACDASHGVCLSAFSTYLVAGLLPPVRVFGLLNMRAYSSRQGVFVRRGTGCLLTPLTRQRFAGVRPFARTGVCKHVKERS